MDKTSHARKPEATPGRAPAPVVVSRLSVPVITAIGFELPRAGRVRLRVSDVEGRLVATLVDDYPSAGQQVAVWQGGNNTGRQAPPALYFVRLEHGGAERIIRVARLK